MCAGCYFNCLTELKDKFNVTGNPCAEEVLVSKKCKIGTWLLLTINMKSHGPLNVSQKLTSF